MLFEYLKTYKAQIFNRGNQQRCSKRRMTKMQQSALSKIVNRMLLYFHINYILKC